MKTLDLVFCWGDVRGDEGEAFCRGPGASPAHTAARMLDDYVGENNPVRIVDAFIDELDLAVLSFAGVVPEATGRRAGRSTGPSPPRRRTGAALHLRSRSRHVASVREIPA